MATAWVMSGVLGFGLGILAGANRGRPIDRIVKGYCFLLASVPTFWLGLVFLIVFSVWLGWFPFGFSVPIGVSAADVTLADALHHLALPALTLSVVGVANIALHTREKTIDVLESDYVRFARTRGLSTWGALRHHGLRNLALPALTLQFASISEIFGGSVLVEQVFSYPGLGQAAVTAGLGGDVALLAGIALFSAAFVFGGNLVANVLYGVVATDFAQKNLAPSLAHPFGTDWMGRDMLLRTLAGLSMSVLVGLLAAGASSVIALVLGAVAALGGKKADAVVTWLIDLMMGIPHIVLLILISFALGKGFWGVTIGVAVTHWPSLARVVRAEILQCRESTFVAVARKLGQSPLRIALKHMVPYVLPQFIVGLILLFPHAILHEAAVTFLGFGLPPEQPAIGVILSESMAYLSAGMWWLAVFPGLALIATVLLFDVAGSNLRKLIDPHSSQE